MALSGFFEPRILGTTIGLALLLGILAVAAPGPLVTIRPVDPDTGRVVLNSPQDVNAAGTNQKFAPGSFDATEYVAGIWSSKVAPWAADHAADLDQLLAALDRDPEQAEQQYGVVSGGDTHNFLVKGQARVASVDTSTPVGQIALVDPSGEDHAISLAAGPLVFGTALRDAFPFLQLNDFTNQMQYASVAKAMNKQALEQAYKGISIDQLKGKTLQFTGAFAASPDGSISIVPIDVKVGS
ncbi:DUF2291 family protein [Salinisphaera sp. Q1T1-3]|uniref:DUF2291 family protein n=1 Tax=Salinisphaera sp. Q1T1-3 TaxID=2321229 RepID=UPI000E710CAE|nr:DUF2291 domain-containing protein [Salinisphaera sp. Q1T1-3]RJS91864.1 DUF2291 domain-containing protein [Salinisphaera sp. Q1T1-3]